MRQLGSHTSSNGVLLRTKLAAQRRPSSHSQRLSWPNTKTTHGLCCSIFKPNDKLKG